jgi:hypothetical protein
MSGQVLTMCDFHVVTAWTTAATSVRARPARRVRPGPRFTCPRSCPSPASSRPSVVSPYVPLAPLIHVGLILPAHA